jgi:hypothetical protein
MASSLGVYKEFYDALEMLSWSFRTVVTNFSKRA